MDSTGVYWIPFFQILEAAGFNVVLVNARHVKNVPGRKSDVADCQWLQCLHSVELLLASYRPGRRCARYVRSFAIGKAWCKSRPSTCSSCKRRWTK
jgi:hypothetical protein